MLTLNQFSGYTSIDNHKILTVVAAVICGIGVFFDLYMVKIYVKSLFKFVELFQIEKMNCTQKVLKSIIYGLLVVLFLLRSSVNMTSITVWNMMVYSDFTKVECEYWIKHWIQDKILIMGWLGDFFPNYCALVIIYIYWVFGNINDINEISDTNDDSSSRVSTASKSVSRMEPSEKSHI